MARFNVLGVPVTIFETVPTPDQLAAEYKHADDERQYQIEATMYDEYNLVNSRGGWEECDHSESEEEEETSSGGGWLRRLFG